LGTTIPLLGLFISEPSSTAAKQFQSDEQVCSQGLSNLEQTTEQMFHHSSFDDCATSSLRDATTWTILLHESEQ
jgi:hypothetical protein